MHYDSANRKEFAALEASRTAEARTRRLHGMVRIINNTADALDTADLKNLSTEKAHELLPSICLLFASTVKLQRRELQSHHPPEQSPRPPAGRNGTVRQKKSSERITPMERHLTIRKLAGLERAAQALGCTPLQLSNFVSESYVPQPGCKAVPTACQNETNLYLKLANRLDLRITVQLSGWTSKMTMGLALTAAVSLGLGRVMCLRFCGQEFEDISHGLIWRGLVFDGELDGTGGVNYEELV